MPLSYLAISKDMHGPPRTRHRDIKLCLVRLAERPNRHAGNDLADCLRLAGVTGDSYSLVEMQSGSSANNLASIEYDLAQINADHGPELVIEKLLPAVFDVFREWIRSPTVSVIFSRSKTLNFPVWSSGNCFSALSFPTMIALEPAKRSMRYREVHQIAVRKVKSAKVTQKKSNKLQQTTV
jgi:hypothetical protein